MAAANGRSSRLFARGTRANRARRPPVRGAPRLSGHGRRQLPKFYILDMFPYPSGAGLHVGHPEGYTATDILARYRRARGYNVLHPMGWDAFGLPAEQYAIKTGQHPRKTTEAEHRHLQAPDQIAWASATIGPARWTPPTRSISDGPSGFSCKLYNRWFNPGDQQGRADRDAPLPARAAKWRQASRPEELEAKARAYRDSKRLAYVTEAPVWWCEQLGTVLANEEVVDGKSEVGGFPVVRKPMRQWMLRITAYAERLLQDLETIDWSESLKEMQRNWIGRSEGAEVDFALRMPECGCGSENDSRLHDPARTRCSARPTWCSRPSISWWTHITTPEPARRRRRHTRPRSPRRATSNAPNWPRKRPASSPAPMPSTRSTAKRSPSGSPTTS